MKSYTLLIFTLSLIAFQLSTATELEVKTETGLETKAETGTQGVTSFVINGFYWLKNVQWQVYASFKLRPYYTGINLANDFWLMGNIYPEALKIVQNSDNSLSLKIGAKYITIGPSSVGVADTVGSWEKVDITIKSGDIWCIRGIANNKYLKMQTDTCTSPTTGASTTCHTMTVYGICDTWESWNLIAP